MKTFLFILGLVVAGICGYSLEPRFRRTLTGKTPGEKPSISYPAQAPAAQPAIDLAKIPSDRLPAKVLLKAEAELADSASDLKVKVSAGSQINLIRLEGANVIISPGAGSFEGIIPIEQTDLMEQLAAMRDTLPPAEPTPEPTPEPEPAAAGSGDHVAIMKASIQAGEIKEFYFDQVLEWLPGEGTETIDGQVYQTGIASYKAETVFGVKTIQAKALIQGGKVVRWLWPKSGMEIK
jgi:hypothetical protein